MFARARRLSLSSDSSQLQLAEFGERLNDQEKMCPATSNETELADELQNCDA